MSREIQYILDVATLNTEYGEGNWRIAFWRQHISVERIPAIYYAKYVYTPVISYGLEHMLDKEFLDGMMPWSSEYRVYEGAVKKSAMDSY